MRAIISDIVKGSKLTIIISENIRGLTYDEIKPKIKSKNMFEKLIDFSDEVYKKVFDSDQ